MPGPVGRPEPAWGHRYSAPTWAHVGDLYPPVITAAKLMFRALDLRRVEGAGSPPCRWGSSPVTVSYLDFIFWVRGPTVAPARHFMAKKPCSSTASLTGDADIPIRMGCDAGLASKQALRAQGRQVVGIFPEERSARHSRSGDQERGIRMAARPVYPDPVAVWEPSGCGPGPAATVQPATRAGDGVDRRAVAPGQARQRNAVAGSCRRMQALLDEVQRDYPDEPAGPDDRWWLPAHLGGTAPTPEEAAEMDARKPEIF